MKEEEFYNNLNLIFEFAQKYADGDRFDKENFRLAKEKILDEIANLKEYKMLYRELLFKGESRYNF